VCEPGRRRCRAGPRGVAGRSRRAAVPELRRSIRRAGRRQPASRVHAVHHGGTPMSASASVADSLTALAEAAGVAPRWIDAHGRRRDTPAETLRAVLAAMDLPAGTPAQARDSLARLALPANQPPALIIVRAGHSVQLPGVRARRYLVHYEDGTCDEGQATGAGDDACLQAPDRPGYHLLELDGRQYALAVAPWRCPSPAQLLQDDSPRAWGIAAQIHSLRRAAPSATAAGDHGAFGAAAEQDVLSGQNC